VPGLAGPATKEAFAALQGILSKEQPDVVIIHELFDTDILDWITARLPSIRFVWGFKLICPGGRRTWQESDQVCLRRVGYMCQAVAYRERCMPRDLRIGLPLISRTIRLVDTHRERSVIVVPSEFMRKLFLHEEFHPSQVHCIPPFTVLPPADSLRPPADPCTVLCAARLTPEKGVHLLLSAIQDIHGARLIIAGDGPERARLESLASQLGIQGRVTFTGWLDPATLAAHLDKASIVVVPSVWPEPFGIVGIEAMAHARPVVAFDVGGVREWLVPGVTGCLVRRGDISGLARAVHSLMDNPEAGRALGKHGRAVVEERFCPDRYTNDFLNVAAAALSRSRSRCEA
jgi:glycosyltransferase involved in cell wall biosynthesis